MGYRSRELTRAGVVHDPGAVVVEVDPRADEFPEVDLLESHAPLRVGHLDEGRRVLWLDGAEGVRAEEQQERDHGQPPVVVGEVAPHTAGQGVVKQALQLASVGRIDEIAEGHLKDRPEPGGGLRPDRPGLDLGHAVLGSLGQQHPLPRPGREREGLRPYLLGQSVLLPTGFDGGVPVAVGERCDPVTVAVPHRIQQIGRLGRDNDGQAVIGAGLRTQSRRGRAGGLGVGEDLENFPHRLAEEGFASGHEVHHGEGGHELIFQVLLCNLVERLEETGHVYL